MTENKHNTPPNADYRVGYHRLQERKDAFQAGAILIKGEPYTLYPLSPFGSPLAESDISLLTDVNDDYTNANAVRDSLATRYYADTHPSRKGEEGSDETDTLRIKDIIFRTSSQEGERRMPQSTPLSELIPAVDPETPIIVLGSQFSNTARYNGTIQTSADPKNLNTLHNVSSILEAIAQLP